ncbi:MAG TPA: lipopolysaccharide assembly protein LapA domain-containing protein [Pilimelia sp.]|nr:lipopolysaccharide assembly protein LapA domain-containing protein [Pilimelia sp.]
MSVLHRNRNASADPAATVPQQDPAGPLATSPAGLVPRTRTGAVWLGICTAAVAFVVLIVFMLQNTRSVEVTFLWMHGSVPLALALLVAGVGVAILAMAVAGLRIGQLRRLSRRRQQAAPL